MGQYKNQELEKEFVIPKVEFPPDGWFHDWFMEKALGEELAEVMKYPLKSSMFTNKKS